MRITRQASLGITRPPCAAGLYYPRDPEVLRGTLQELLRAPAVCPAGSPKALVVPHSAYAYSGAIAGAGYHALAAARDTVRHVVLVGPTHRTQGRALATPSCAFYSTPIGDVPIYSAGRQRLRELGIAGIDDGPHAAEHSLEVQVPFLLAVLDRFDLLPLAVGTVLPEQVAQALDAVWGGPETIVIVSSDLSHHHTHIEAEHLDAATADAILARRSDLADAQACGAICINGLLQMAQRKALHVYQLARGTSADAAGDSSRVVGYGSFALYESPTA